MKCYREKSVFIVILLVLLTTLNLSCTDSDVIDDTDGDSEDTSDDGDVDVYIDGDNAVDGDTSVDGDMDTGEQDVVEEESQNGECIRTYESGSVGMIMNNGKAQSGYTLFAPNSSRTVYLINLCGEVVHSWECGYMPGQAVYLLEDGRLLHTANPGRTSHTSMSAGGEGGIVQLFSFDGELEWSYELYNSDYRLHHDVEMLPNGNILAIAWEHKTASEAVEAGRNPASIDSELWPDAILELDPTKGEGEEIVWEWHIWDHLIQDYDATKENYGTVADHPELMDLNYYQNRESEDWVHTNAVDYNEELNQIALSLHNMGEIIIIEHTETSEIAAGHTGGQYGMGGDILYRWGNPRVYDAGDANDQYFFGQHDVNWIEDGYPGEGNLLVFNNGLGRKDGEYSSVDEIVTPITESGTYSLNAGEAFGPTTTAWTYLEDPPENFYSANISGAQRLKNGNTLICEGANGRIFEVTDDGEMVWEYINPVTINGILTQGETVPSDGQGQQNSVFRAYRYAEDYPGLAGRDLTPQGFIELSAD